MSSTPGGEECWIARAATPIGDAPCFLVPPERGIGVTAHRVGPHRRLEGRAPSGGGRLLVSVDMSVTIVAALRSRRVRALGAALIPGGMTYTVDAERTGHVVAVDFVRGAARRFDAVELDALTPEDPHRLLGRVAAPARRLLDPYERFPLLGPRTWGQKTGLRGPRHLHVRLVRAGALGAEARHAYARATELVVPLVGSFGVAAGDGAPVRLEPLSAASVPAGVQHRVDHLDAGRGWYLSVIVGDESAVYAPAVEAALRAHVSPAWRGVALRGLHFERS